MEENQGCLAALLGLIGVRLTPKPGALPYRRRDDFLSAAEFAFHRVLVTAAGPGLVVCPKVNLADVFLVIQPNENMAYRNKIDRKHVDFLLCDAASMQPRLGVELDDRSHQRVDRQERDAFVESVFAVAGLPLLRIPAQRGYDADALSSQIRVLLGVADDVAAPVPQVAAVAAEGDRPSCPKCGVSMVLRTASRGDNRGNQFYGCPNYPKCREVRPFLGA